MGFAGQIFAARVAVGLAVPSPKAMQAQGGLLAKGIESMYKRTNSVALNAMKQRAAETKAAAESASAGVVSAQATVNNQLTAGLSETLARGSSIGETFGRTLAAEGEKQAGAFGKLAELDPAIGGKLLADMDSAMSASAKAEQMVRNWGKMSAAEQKAAMDRAKTVADMSEADLVNIQKEIEAMEALAAEQDDSAKDGRTIAGKQRKIYLERIQQLEGEEEAAKEVHEESKVAMQDLKRISTFVDGTAGPAIEGLNNAKKASAEADKTATKTSKAYEESLKGVETTSVAVAQAAHDAAYQVKQGFTEAVRESVSVLTGFYYEMNQATSALIEFEAELLNANSVWNESRDTLFDTAGIITQFGQQFGISMQNGATGLYQLASAGLSAEESMQILPETLKLSMAVQGDHNTIAKLTTQTLFGFEMEANRAAEVTDKFAHAIQKSLIEYEDLSSAVKFALPFFTSTGQSIDQLLGSLQILTNRALEAGIAGRGLRQALAEFAEGAEDNTTAFRQMGIEILNADGSMKQLTEIAAAFAKVVGEDTVNNTELLTALIQDLNVRGATAFIHLVQSSDEFTQAVQNSENAAGELDQMVQIQNESLKAQIQILKNNVEMIFFMRDANYEGTEFMNAFHEAVVGAVASLTDLLVVQVDGVYKLTEFGQTVQDVAVKGIGLLVELVEEAVIIVRDLTKEGVINLELLKLYAIPLKLILDFLQLIGPEGTRFLLYMHMLSKILPITTVLQTYQSIATLKSAHATMLATQALAAEIPVKTTSNAVETKSIWQRTVAIYQKSFLNGLTWKKISLAAASFIATLKNVWAIGLENTMLQQSNTSMFAQNTLIATNTGRHVTNILARLQSIATRISEIATQIWETIVTWAQNVALAVQTAGKWMLNTANLVWLAGMILTLPWLIISTTATWTMTAAIWSFTAAIFAIPLVGWLLLGIVLVVGALYVLQKEFDVIGMTIDGFRAIFQAIGDKITQVYEDYIFPFLYKFGNEFMALGGIIAFAVGALMAKIQEIGASIRAALPEWVIDWLKAILLFPLQFPIAIFQTAFGIVQSVFGGLLDTLGTIWSLLMGDISLGTAVEELKKIWVGVFTTIGEKVLALIDKVNILKKAADLAKAVVDFLPLATGGYVTAMQSGGQVGRGPYLVGERGPEIFVPNASGQVLNNRRTEDILGESMGRGAPTKGAQQQMVVKELFVTRANVKKTRMGIDSFAGVI